MALVVNEPDEDPYDQHEALAEEGDGDESGESGESCRRFALGGGSGVAHEVRFKFGTRITGVI